MPSEARAPRAAAQVCAAETLPAELQWGGKGAESRAGRCENSFFSLRKRIFFEMLRILEDSLSAVSKPISGNTSTQCIVLHTSIQLILQHFVLG